ncbi:phosphoenolpyruvate carboxykinase (ATP) [Rhodothermus bifroesti]|jgi:phosphoenolpyruvate carboxykinase (ATP)|uniref:Phosphoenolpyruvate carboxykinase (ATP) n=1 Tax=Rhodothermus marinus TaxID=29549 RepID=A0A7V2AYX9_RHOMR|nr:phosphoenolpyruvate carboxykinase (ATP) [Rhodothermus bifroesti]GBD00786.1 Phosphoenolpyruvate carboxykinase (ATP) [bacterium HR18]
MDLTAYGLHVPQVLHNPSPAVLYEEAIRFDPQAALVSSGALACTSGRKTGRSPADKRIVEHPESQDHIWWGPINIPLDEHTFLINRERAIDYLNTRARLYVVDGFAGWDPKYRLKVRVICERPYHALFMHNLLIRPSTEELIHFGEPDYVILNAGRFPANRYTSHMTSQTSVDLSFERREMVILGTEYAGEMKKGIFTVMNYLMPLKGVLSMHCAANEGPRGDVTLFFGLSGTGKTTLSADPQRRLIGDDEHCWTDEGIFNIEGGCYAKVIHLSPEHEPQIYRAIRFGTVLENVVFDPQTRQVDYADASITENTRAAYPIEFIDNAKIPCRGGHPSNILFLTYDAFGVLPPVARLTPEQAMYHFISGYTAKVAGTEVGVTEPQATFSACFGAAFLVWHPFKYAEMLAERIRRHGTQVWLVNTGLTGGPYGQGRRIPLAYTRALVDAIHNGTLAQVPTEVDERFGFAVPVRCPGVPEVLLQPRNTWESPEAYDEMANRLARLFAQNFEKYRAGCTQEVAAAGPCLARM